MISTRHLHKAQAPCDYRYDIEIYLYLSIYLRVQNMHHKFMRASYMKHFAKFLAILHHIASFFTFCFIINFLFNKNLLHILEILLLYYCCLSHSATDCH